MYAMEKALKTVEQTYKDWNEGNFNQGEALTMIQSDISVLERCVNKCNTPGDGSQDILLQKQAAKKFPHLEISSLDFKIEA